MMPSITEQSFGKWPVIYSQLAPEMKQNIKHQPCPVCGGKDRFRLFKDWPDTGSAICNQCSAGNGLEWVKRLNNASFENACKTISEIVSANSNQFYGADVYRAQFINKQKQKERQKLQDKVLREQQLKVAEKATQYWESGCEAAHPYLTNKRLPQLNTRCLQDKLLVPLIDVNGVIWNLQSIFSNGAKRFLFGGRVKELFSLLWAETLPTEGRLYIAEGWATAATIYIQTGYPVAAAMNAGNLLPVAKAISKKSPELEIIIAADDDRGTAGNPGRAKAIATAKSIGAGIVFPEFCSTDCTCTDFNDTALCGKEARA